MYVRKCESTSVDDNVATFLLLVYVGNLHLHLTFIYSVCISMDKYWGTVTLVPSLDRKIIK